MIEFLVVRHGQSVADVEQRHEGRADFPLTELGRRQAGLAAGWIAANLPPDVLLASPLRRAAETAQIIAQRVGLTVQLVDDLMEFNNGARAGLLRSEAQERFPWPAGGYKPHEPVPGGESAIAFRARAEIAWSRLLDAATDGQRVGIVAHGGIIDRLFCCFLKLPTLSEVRLVTGDTGIHLWRVDGAARQILFANRTAHLETL